MMEGALNTIGQAGLPGALLVVALGAIAWLTKALLNSKDASREDRGEVVKALMESAHAQRETAKAITDNTEVMRRVLERGA